MDGILSQAEDEVVSLSEINYRYQWRRSSRDVGSGKGIKDRCRKI